MRVAVVIPTYGQFDYAEQALQTLSATCDDFAALVVDDASPTYTPEIERQLRQAVPKGTYYFHRFADNFGITRSWNWGLRKARELGAEYTVTTNSDILFTPGWWEPFLAVLQPDRLALAGPLTNAPGDSPQQWVLAKLADYTADDSPAALAETAEKLLAYREAWAETPVNGFFQIAKTATFWANAHTRENVYNPQYRMVRSEYDLQRRLLARGLKRGVAYGSFVFHYRGVSRGLGRGPAKRGAFRRATC